MVAFIGSAGLVIDVAQLHIVQGKLQSAANAAALASATDLSTSGTMATATACTFSASDDGTGTCNGSKVTSDCNGQLSTPNCQNALSGYSVQTTAKLGCLSAQTVGTSSISCTPNNLSPPTTNTPFSPACVPSATNTCNAIQVTETTSVSPWFMQELGFGSTTLTATATASETGGIPEPLDVQMIVDSTASLGDYDTQDRADTCGTGGITSPNGGIPGNDLTYEDCAKAGVRALLDVLLPCQEGLASCGTPSDGNVPDPVDEVGLMTFPSLNSCQTTGTPPCENPTLSKSYYVDPGNGLGVPAETGCTTDISGGGDPNSDVTYNDNPNYYGNYSNAQVVPFSSDYRTSDTATALNGGVGKSPLVNSVDWLDCPGGTYDNGSNTQSSISGGSVPQDVTTATNSAAGITEVGSNSATTAGISEVSSAPSTNTTGYGIAGGPNSGSGDYTTTSKNSVTGITVTRPGTRAIGDFILVTVTGASASVTSGSNICPTAATTGWTLVDQHISGTVIQATYSSTRPTNAAESYVFNFFTGSCPVPENGAGTLTLDASATALRYTGVASVDAAATATNVGVPTPASGTGSASSTSWLTSGSYGSTVSSTGYSGTATYDSFSSGSSCASSALCDTTVGANVTAITGATFTFATGTARGQVFTVSLLINNTVPGCRGADLHGRKHARPRWANDMHNHGKLGRDGRHEQDLA